MWFNRNISILGQHCYARSIQWLEKERITFLPNFLKTLRERLQILSIGCFVPSVFRRIQRMQST